MFTKNVSISRFLVVVSILMVGMTRIASADMVAGVSLNAQSIADAFNNLNNGQGSSFKLSLDPNTNYFYNGSAVKGYEFADTSAYSPSKGQNTIFSLCVEPFIGTISKDGFAKLNYADGQSTTSNAQNVLSLGAAYLYMLYATTDMATSYELGAAIRYMMGDWDYHDSFYVGWGNQFLWEPNEYLTDLWKINNNKDYWTAAYNPDAYYDEIGNYCVFVLDPMTDGISNQNFLYIANAVPAEQPVTPEPATMLMLGVGLMGLPFIRHLRKKDYR